MTFVRSIFEPLIVAILVSATVGYLVVTPVSGGVRLPLVISGSPGSEGWGAAIRLIFDGEVDYLNVCHQGRNYCPRIILTHPTDGTRIICTSLEPKVDGVRWHGRTNGIFSHPGRQSLDTTPVSVNSPILGWPTTMVSPPTHFYPILCDPNTSTGPAKDGRFLFFAPADKNSLEAARLAAEISIHAAGSHPMNLIRIRDYIFPWEFINPTTYNAAIYSTSPANKYMDFRRWTVFRSNPSIAANFRIGGPAVLAMENVPIRRFVLSLANVEAARSDARSVPRRINMITELEQALGAPTGDAAIELHDLIHTLARGPPGFHRPPDRPTLIHSMLVEWSNHVRHGGGIDMNALGFINAVNEYRVAKSFAAGGPTRDTHMRDGARLFGFHGVDVEWNANVDKYYYSHFLIGGLFTIAHANAARRLTNGNFHQNLLGVLSPTNPLHEWIYLNLFGMSPRRIALLVSKYRALEDEIAFMNANAPRDQQIYHVTHQMFMDQTWTEAEIQEMVTDSNNFAGYNLAHSNAVYHRDHLGLNHGHRMVWTDWEIAFVLCNPLIKQATIFVWPIIQPNGVVEGFNIIPPNNLVEHWRIENANFGYTMSTAHDGGVVRNLFNFRQRLKRSNNSLHPILAQESLAHTHTHSMMQLTIKGQPARASTIATITPLPSRPVKVTPTSPRSTLAPVKPMKSFTAAITPSRSTRPSQAMTPIKVSPSIKVSFSPSSVIDPFSVGPSPTSPSYKPPPSTTKLSSISLTPGIGHIAARDAVTAIMTKISRLFNEGNRKMTNKPNDISTSISPRPRAAKMPTIVKK